MPTERPSADRPAGVPAPMPPAPPPRQDAGGWGGAPRTAPPARVGPATALLSLMVVAALYFGRDIFVPLALAALLAFVLDPLVTRLRRWRLPRPAAVGLVMLCTVAVLGATSVFMGNQVVQLSKDLPTYQATVQAKLRALRQVSFGRGMWGDASRMLDAVGSELEALDGSPQRHATPAPRVRLEPAPRSALQTIADVVNPVLEPLATAGIVLIFSIIMLMQRNDLRDRVLRLVGGDLHHTTDALVEAGQRVSRYLGTQLLVNLLGFGLPMAIGLMLIGVPGAWLWGLLAALLRFVPYVGTLLAVFFPLAMAFAVDPGWSMALWSIGLFLAVEFVIVYLVEPWVYGASTGLSPVSIIVAAVFWTALWGPIGLILATPLTVCLAALGRHLPHMQWLDLLLGSSPVFDPATRLYQRLLADDLEEAIEMADEAVAAQGLAAFYDATGVPALRLAARDHSRVASAEHRHRVATGMAALIHDLREQHPSPDDAPPRVLCVGGRWETDTLAADMLAHALAQQGVAARVLPAAAVSADQLGLLELEGVQALCLSYFSPTPEAQIRFVARRLKRRGPGLRLVVAAWNAGPELLAPEAAEQLGVDAIAHTLAEALARLASGTTLGQPAVAPAPPRPADEPQRCQALADSGLLDPALRGPLDRSAQRVADVFDMPMAMVALVDADARHWHGATGLTQPDGRVLDRRAPREASLCADVVATGQTLAIADLARDPRFAARADGAAAGLRAYAGAPLRDANGQVLGALCVSDRRPHRWTATETRLLEAMADDLMHTLAAPPPARAAEAPVAGGKATSGDGPGDDEPLPSPA
jgi:predicted PurR-regulated permease PerM